MTLYLSLVSHSTMSSAVPQRQTPSMDAPSSPTTPSSVAAATPVRPQSLDFTEPSTSSAHPLPPPLPPAVQQRPEELERERAPPPSPQKQQSVDQPSEVRRKFWVPHRKFGVQQPYYAFYDQNIDFPKSNKIMTRVGIEPVMVYWRGAPQRTAPFDKDLRHRYGEGIRDHFMTKKFEFQKSVSVVL